MSGSAAFGSGTTDSTNAGGTGGATGAVTVGSGAALSTLGTSGATGNTIVESGASADGNSGDVILRAGTAGGVQGVVQVSAARIFDLDVRIDADVALTAAGDLLNAALQLNHATDEGEAIDASAVQLTTARSAGTLAAVRASTTSLAGDTGGIYAAVVATHTDGGGSAIHYGLLVDGTSDLAVGSANSTAGGAAAATPGLTIRSGNRVKDDADAGVPGSGAVVYRSGDASVTAAAIGGASGAVTLRSGDTDSTSAGGTGGITGAATLRSGHATSTLGTSGDTGTTTLSTGNSTDAASGDTIVSTGSAGTTRGVVRIEAANRLQVRVHSTVLLADPGTGVAISAADSADVAITVGAGAETNTLAIPTYRGQTMGIFAESMGIGSRAITAASAINQAGNTIITLQTVNDYILLRAAMKAAAGTLAWRIALNDGCTLS